MANSTTMLQGDLLLDNQLELVTPTTVAGTLYGIAFTLFCLYAHSLVPQLQDKGRKTHTRFMLVYSAVIMLCGLYYLVSNAWLAQEAYIKHGNHPGGPYFYEVTQYHAPALAVLTSCQVVINILTSAVQIWRVWVIWSATRYAAFVIVLPSLCFVTFTALTLRTLILEITLPIGKLEQLDSKTEIATIAIQAATTILCTALISLFLIFQQWRQRKLIGKAQGSVGYMKVVAILIESYALESTWLLILAALLTHPVGTFFTESVTYIEIIAYLLVLYRVSSGRGYESQKGRSHISSLHWNHSNHVTTQFEVTSDSDAVSNHLVAVKPEGSVSSMA